VKLQGQQWAARREQVVEHRHITTFLNKNPHNDLYFLGTMCFVAGCTLGKEAKNSNLLLMGGSEQGQTPVEVWEMVEK